MKAFARVVLLLVTVITIGAIPFINTAINENPLVDEAFRHHAGGAVGTVTFDNGEAQPVAGQEPMEPELAAEIIVDAKSNCEVGELVRIDISKSTIDSAAWKSIPETEDFEVTNTGLRAYFSSRAPGVYTLFIAGAKNSVAVSYIHTIVVEGSGVVIPPGQVTLATKIKGWVNLVPKEHLDKKAPLAGVFRAVVQEVDKGKIGVDKILESTSLSNRAVLDGKDSPAMKAWIPFLDALGKELDGYVERDELTTKEQYKKVWLSIAEGLDKA